MLLQGTYRNIGGQEVALEDFQGSVVLVVNTASHCGRTPLYKTLEGWWQRYRDEGFCVLGFPSACFGNQEFAENSDIAEFSRSNYCVSFPLFERSDVLSRNELFLKLAEKSAEPSWNFTMYLIGREGELLGRFEPEETETAEEAIQSALAS
jgi:glutathione peroxidase